jgi:hypothetical protein
VICGVRYIPLLAQLGFITIFTVTYSG